jgi:hypothetical protein
VSWSKTRNPPATSYSRLSRSIVRDRLFQAGGLAILHGATAAEDGEVLIPINPGPERIGRLVQCSYFSERRQQQVIAYVLFVP